MFRPITILGPVLALALVALSACSDGPARRSSPAAGGPAPTATTASPGTSAPPRSSLPATRPGTDDQSLRLGGTGDGSGDSCRVQCERSNNSCMDSVAARTQSGTQRPDRMEPFTPSDNCQYQLRQCYQRCGAAVR